MEPDHIADLELQLWIGAELEHLDPVRLDVPLAPDRRHAGERDAQLARQEPRRPVRDPQRVRLRDWL
jgi:hypothetical protein